MKIHLSLLILFLTLTGNPLLALPYFQSSSSFVYQIGSVDSAINPLATYSVKWNDKKFKSCNSAMNIQYLTEEEKNVIWILNMIRYDPQLFLKTVLKNNEVISEWEGSNFNSLIADINGLKPNTNVLMPDLSAYNSAKCHAIHSGITGYVGHERLTGDCNKDFFGECCHYGSKDAFTIVMDLLVDEGVESLGHRILCLSSDFDKLGVSIQSHKSYRFNTVMDFK
jgi:hypothetical protein